MFGIVGGFEGRKAAFTVSFIAADHICPDLLYGEAIMPLLLKLQQTAFCSFLGFGDEKNFKLRMGANHSADVAAFQHGAGQY